MTSYVVRKLLIGVVTLFCVTAFSFFALIELPGGARDIPRMLRRSIVYPRVPPPEVRDLNNRLRFVHLSFPENYFDWWLDTRAPDLSYVQGPGYIEEKLRTWTAHTKTAGVLTGYLGYSLGVFDYDPVSKYVGEGWWLVPLTALFTAIAFTVVATVQRRNRPPALRTSAFLAETIRDNSALLRLRNGV